MKKLWILSAIFMLAISCNKDDSDDEVVITYLEGSEFTLSQFGVHTFPSADTWVIEDQSATAADFAGISAAIEYISSSDVDREITLEFENLSSIPAYAIFGTSYSDSFRTFSALYSVSAPYVTSVGDNAFEYCTGLVNVDIENAQSIGMYAFRDCSSLKEAYFPLVETAGFAAFSGCKSMVSAEFPLLDSVSEQSFYLCSSLSEIYLPEALTIDAGAFSYCSSLVTFEAPIAVLIGERAFCEATLLQNFEVPMVESIGDYAFISCSSLESFVIETNVTSIGAGVFNNCSSLADLSDKSGYYVVIDGILYNDPQTMAIAALPIYAVGDVVLLDTTTEIADRLFYDCDQLTSVELPAVVSIAQNTFANCSSLISATLPAATTFEDQAFYNCEYIETITAPKLTTIGSKAFYNCDYMENLYFATDPGVVITSIDAHAFHSAYILYTVVTLGAANADLVTYGDTITVGDFEMEFAEVVVLEV